jgi:predicted membrane-bound mannosyltransferase/DNA-binding beta-propeller fold protein YncE
MTATADAAGIRGPAVFDRALGIRISISRETVIYAVIFAAAIALRFWDLGSRSLHHDESIHAQWSWGLLQGSYRHDPVFHGPLYYHVQGLVFLIFGASDYTARVSAAVFGSVLVALPLLLRKRLGPVGTIAAVSLIAFSPTIVYYSRFFREDIYMAVFTMVMAASMWRYFTEGRERWLIVFALAFAASMATKEATYLTVAVFLVYIDLYFSAQLATATLRAREMDSAWRRVLLTVGLAIPASVIAALWPFLGSLRRRMSWPELPRSGDMLVLLGTLTVPLLTPVLRGPLESFGVVAEKRLVCQSYWDDDLKRVVARGSHPARDALAVGGLFAITLSAAAFVGLQWKARTWAIAVGAGALLYLTLMTSLWTNLEGLCSGPWSSLDYWLSQQGERRGEQPWFYYYMLMPAYEFLPLVIAIGGIWWSTIKGDAFSRFLWVWMVGTWVALSMAGEKMPWLNVHIALPAAVLAAWTIARAFRAWQPMPPPGRVAPTLASLALVAMGAFALIVFLPGGAGWNAARVALVLAAVGIIAFAVMPHGRRAIGAAVAVAVLGALGLFTVRTMLMASFERGDVPKDLLIYTQSSPDIPVLARQIDQLGAATGKGLDLPIALDSTDSFAWPWAWYLRDYRAVTYTDFANGVPTGDFAVMLVNQSNASRVLDALQQAGDTRFGNPVPYPHRWWFDESRYREPMTGTVDGQRQILGPWDGVHEVGPVQLPSGIPNMAAWKRIGSGIFGGEWLPEWFDYWRDHDPGIAPGSVDAVAYFPANFDRQAGLLTARAVTLPGPTVDTAGRPAFGGIGALPGQFFSPVDIESDSAGNLYVIDRATRKLQKFDQAGNFLAAVDIRVNPADRNEGAEPWGLAIAPNGNVIVADTFGWRVRIFDRDLQAIGGFGNPPTPNTVPGPYDLFGPRDVGIDAQGNLWVTDTGNARIVIYSSTGEYIRELGTRGSGPGQFNEPVGINIAGDGAVFVADMYNLRVAILNPDGSYRGEFEVEGWGGTDVKDKPYLRALRDGRVAVSLPSQNEVRVYDQAGTVTQVIAPADDPLNRPYGIIETADGTLWIAEGGSGRVRQFPLD